MKSFGIRVFVEKNKQYGHIVRRLNAHSYEIWLDSEVEVIVGPEEFFEVEVKKKEKNE